LVNEKNPLAVINLTREAEGAGSRIQELELELAREHEVRGNM